MGEFAIRIQEFDYRTKPGIKILVGTADLLELSKQIDVSFSYVCPVIDHEFRHNIVKVVLDPRVDSRVDPQTISARDFDSFRKVIDCEISLVQICDPNVKNINTFNVIGCLLL